MIQLSNGRPRRLAWPRIVAGVTFSILLAVTLTAAPAQADDHRGGGRDDHHDRRDHRRDDHGRWRPGYPPPPVVYAPYYAPPPVVYGPSIGIALPGVSIGIH